MFFKDQRRKSLHRVTAPNPQLDLPLSNRITTGTPSVSLPLSVSLLLPQTPLLFLTHLSYHRLCQTTSFPFIPSISTLCLSFYPPTDTLSFLSAFSDKGTEDPG